MTRKLDLSRLYELPPVPVCATLTTPQKNAGGEGAAAPQQLSNRVNALNNHLAAVCETSDCCYDFFGAPRQSKSEPVLFFTASFTSSRVMVLVPSL